MELYKVALETTNELRKVAWDKKNDKYIDVIDGYIFVSKRDLDYVMKNYKFISIEYVGLIFERPTELVNED
jgi:hypothetical protein